MEVSSNYIKNNNIVDKTNIYNHYFLIKDYINSDIIPYNNNLIKCMYSNKDENNEPAHEYYIKFKGNLSFTERKKLHLDILKKN